MESLLLHGFHIRRQLSSYIDGICDFKCLSSSICIQLINNFIFISHV